MALTCSPFDLVLKHCHCWGVGDTCCISCQSKAQEHGNKSHSWDLLRGLVRKRKMCMLNLMGASCPKAHERKKERKGGRENRKEKERQRHKYMNHLQMKTGAHSGSISHENIALFHQKGEWHFGSAPGTEGAKSKSHRRTSGWQTPRNTTPASSSCVYAVTACPLSTQNMFWGWKRVLRASKVWSDNARGLFILEFPVLAWAGRPQPSQLWNILAPSASLLKLQQVWN